MKKNHTQENSENPSTKQSNAEQLSLFEWAGIPDDSPDESDRIHSLIANDFWALVKRSGIFEDSGVGFAVRNGF
jgi:hypothetical protein